MKRSLIKLLLALALVFNPVSVLASDFYSMEYQSMLLMEQVSHESAGQQNKHSELTQHDGTDCEMPCCEDSECVMQHICVVQHHSDFVTQKLLKFSHPIENRSGWHAFIAVVPNRELPPENPPPIHV